MKLTTKMTIPSGRSSERLKPIWRLTLTTALAVALLFSASACAETASSTTDVVPTPGAEPSAVGLSSGLPKIIDLGSDKCIPCQMMAPELEALATDYAGAVEVVIVDVYENQEEAMRWNIYVIPTQIFLDSEGNELARHEGFMTTQEMVAVFAERGYALTPAAGD